MDDATTIRIFTKGVKNTSSYEKDPHTVMDSVTEVENSKQHNNIQHQSFHL